MNITHILKIAAYIGAPYNKTYFPKMDKIYKVYDMIFDKEFLNFTVLQ